MDEVCEICGCTTNLDDGRAPKCSRVVYGHAGVTECYTEGYARLASELRVARRQLDDAEACVHAAKAALAAAQQEARAAALEEADDVLLEYMDDLLRNKALAPASKDACYLEFRNFRSRLRALLEGK